MVLTGNVSLVLYLTIGIFLQPYVKVYTTHLSFVMTIPPLSGTGCSVVGTGEGVVFTVLSSFLK